MRFAYADPPYVGQARKHYGKHPDFAGEVDHAELVARLVVDYPDGWALSLSAASIHYVLALCPADVRVLAWCKTMTPMLPGVRLQYGWEPVILRGGRQGPHITGRAMVRDWLACHPQEQMYRRADDGHVIGRKPRQFCRWLFECMGAECDDSFDDLFPGTGNVGREWAAFSAQMMLPAA